MPVLSIADGASGTWTVIAITAVVSLLVVVGNVWLQWYYVRVILPLFDRDAPFSPREGVRGRFGEEHTVTTPDGLALRTTLFRGRCDHDESPQDAARPLIVFAAEFGSTRWTALFYATALLDAGYDVLAFDFRNQGDSESLDTYRPSHWLSEFELTDLRAILDYVASEENLRDRPLGLMGISRGGCASLVAAAEFPNVQAVFVEGVYTAREVTMLFANRWGRLHMPGWMMRWIPRWHILWTLDIARGMIAKRRGCLFVDLEGRLKSLAERPVQLVAGKRDSYVPLEVTDVVLREMRHTRDSLWLVPKAKHNMVRDTVPEEFDRRLVGHFAVLHGVPEEPIAEASSV